VAGPVIQATGRSEFEDGLGSGDFVSGYSYHMSVVSSTSDIVSALSCLTLRSRPNSKANGLAMLKYLFPLLEYRSAATSGQSVLGWVTAYGFEMELGHLVPASEVAGRHTLPF
jgi:hypothetical protein